jgi:nucleotide-binding universal stress UspA family protein
VHLVDTLFDLPVGWRRLAAEMELLDLKQLAEHERRAQLEAMAEPLRAEGLRVATRVTWGRPFMEIIRDVLRDGHDLVVTSDSHAEGLGRTATHLIRKCPVPVWVTRAPLHGGTQRVLAAVDPTLHERERNDLDRVVLTAAAGFAEKLEAELHVVHVWQPLTDLLPQSKALADRRMRKFVAETRVRHAKWLSELIADTKVTLPEKRVHLVEGDPARRVNEVAHEIGADLLVMGTVRITGVRGLLIGQTAERILERVRTHVLAIKPVGFVSPVEPGDSRIGNKSTVGN